MKRLLVSLKSKLCEYISQETDEYNIEQLEYLINLVDYFLTDKVSIDELNILIEEVVCTAVMQVRFELLNYVKPFSKECKNGKISLRNE